MRIKRMITTGEFNHETVKTTDDLLEQASYMLDAARAADIIPKNVFLGSDNQWYTITVEAVISRATDEFVAEMVMEEEGEEV